MENVLLENTPGLTIFSKDNFDDATALADRWSGGIDKLRREVEEDCARAGDLIRQHMLELSDVGHLDVP